MNTDIKVCYGKLFFSHFYTKTYVVGAQKNRTNETVLLSTPKHMFKLMGKKIITIYAKKSISGAMLDFTDIFEPRHEISNNVVCATSKGSEQQSDQSLC